MATVYRIGGIELVARMDQWNPDPNAAWRLELARRLTGNEAWWRTILGAVPNLRTVRGRITYFTTHTNGHGPAGFIMWSADEHRELSGLTDPPVHFAIGQPVEIDYVLLVPDSSAGTGGWNTPSEFILEIRAGVAVPP
jgi:hypothetical protein